MVAKHLEIRGVDHFAFIILTFFLDSCMPCVFLSNITSVEIQVPWKGLGKEPVIVLIDRVFILAHPVVDGRSLKVGAYNICLIWLQ